MDDVFEGVHDVVVKAKFGGDFDVHRRGEGEGQRVKITQNNYMQEDLMV